MPRARLDWRGCSVGELQRTLIPGRSPLPEFDQARRDLPALLRAPLARMALASTEPLLHALAPIPETTYSRYRHFTMHGGRGAYEAPYNLKRERLSAMVLHHLLGLEAFTDAIHDYLWSICEESTWVVPAHQGRSIDLYGAETGLDLADILYWLGDDIDVDVRQRVRMEVERRILDPYLRYHFDHRWARSHDNWNAVCNSMVASTFLLIEPEPARVAQALRTALDGLAVYLDHAFAADGSTGEGVNYWHYGMSKFVVLAELLYARSDGAVDLLASERVRRIAAYPASVQLSASSFASFSDSTEQVTFHPGIIARLSERTGERSLLNLLAVPREPQSGSLTSLLRYMLWGNGVTTAPPHIDDAVLADGGVVRLTGRASGEVSIVLMVKAGHNDENHNHNDVGSFIVHVGDESLLVDPGPGRYDRAYFSDNRYDSIFANSYGHSVPRVNEQLQGTGQEFTGTFMEMALDATPKRVTLDIGHAYPVDGLASAVRQFSLAGDGTVVQRIELCDTFRFKDTPGTVEDAFVTWRDVEIMGTTALIRGERHTLLLTMVEPAVLSARVERIPVDSLAGEPPRILHRISYTLPAAMEVTARFHMAIESDEHIRRRGRGGAASVTQHL